MPVTMPNPTIVKYIKIMPNAILLFGILFFEKTGFRSRVSLTGQASTQLIHVEHSSDTTLITLSTLINDGQALAHNPQSIQLTGLRLILLGLSNDANPKRAP